MLNKDQTLHIAYRKEGNKWKSYTVFFLRFIYLRESRSGRGELRVVGRERRSRLPIEQGAQLRT